MVISQHIRAATCHKDMALSFHPYLFVLVFVLVFVTCLFYIDM